MSSKSTVKLIELRDQLFFCACGYEGKHILFRRKTLEKILRGRTTTTHTESDSCPGCHKILATAIVYDNYITCCNKKIA